MTDNPFDELDVLEEVKEPEEADLVDSLTSIVRRLAAIEDELSRRGAEKLNKEKKTLRDKLKKLMLDNELNLVFDETSNFEGVLKQRHTDHWDEKKFRESVDKKKQKRYIRVIPRREELDVGAVVEGVKNGDLSLARLTVDGAFTRTPTTKALYVQEREDE